MQGLFSERVWVFNSSRMWVVLLMWACVLSAYMYEWVDAEAVAEGDPPPLPFRQWCPVHLPTRTPSAVSVPARLCQLDGVGSDGVFLALTPSWADRTGSVTGSQNKRAMNMQSSSINSQGGKKMLDVAESENKQFFHIQAAALTPSAYFFWESDCLSIFILLTRVGGETFFHFFYHKTLNHVSLYCHNIMKTGEACAEG